MMIFAWFICAALLLTLYGLVFEIVRYTWRGLKRTQWLGWYGWRNNMLPIFISAVSIMGAIVFTVTFPVPWPF